MNILEAKSEFAAHLPMMHERGVFPVEDAQSYLPEEFRYNFKGAMDAVPALTTTPNAGIPVWLSMYIDPKPYEVFFAPNEAGNILGEKQQGDWVTDTLMFSVVERTGEVSAYGDFNGNGRAGANANFPQRQVFPFQTHIEYGDREVEKQGLARLDWVTQKDQAASDVLDQAMNTTWFFGVQGLQNYGLLNDPNLSAALTPALKAYGGTTWYSGGVVKATANEMFNDVQAVITQVVTNSAGRVNAKSKMTLALSPSSEIALSTPNSFGLTTLAMLKGNFPNLEVKNAVQYGIQTATNPQGNVAGNLMQVIATEIAGQETAYCSFTAKRRDFPIVRAESSYRKKAMGGSGGSIIRMPAGIASMVGI